MPDFDNALKEFMVCSLDLISGLARGLRDFELLAQNSNLLALLFECIKVLKMLKRVLTVLLGPRFECAAECLCFSR